MSNWIESPRENPPPEGVLVEARGDYFQGQYTIIAQRIDYRPGSSKRQLKQVWRWCDEHGNALSDQAIDSWRPQQGKGEE